MEVTIVESNGTGELREKIAKLEAQVELLTRLIGGGGFPDAVNIKNHVHPSMFTPKQHAVIQGIHEGWETKYMADKMKTTESTAKGHIKAVMDKLVVRTRPLVIEKTMPLMNMNPDDYRRLTGISQSWAESDGDCEHTNEVVWRKLR